MRVVVTCVLGSLFFAAWVYADNSKKGHSICEGARCDFREVPPTGIYEEASDFASDLYSRAKNRSQEGILPAPQSSTTPSSKKRAKKQIPAIHTTTKTNLPSYYQGIDRSGIESSDQVVFVPKASDVRMKGLKSGDVVWAVVEQEIVASPNVPTPIRAIAIGGPFKGGFFLGEATLDKDLKRVLFSFTKLRFKDTPTVYSLKATGLSPRGSIGLEGEYVSQSGKFFVAELGSAGAAGFLDSTVQRNQNAYGNYVQAPGLNNSGKLAAATALSKTTEQMADAVRSAPEYTRTEGYQEIQVILQEDPVESGG